MTIISKLRSIVKAAYYQTTFLLPIKIANRLLIVNPGRNWSILIYEGDNPLALNPASNTQQPVMSRYDVNDTYTAFVADPFIVKYDRKWLMFFELLNTKTQKGQIAYAESEDCLNWNYQQVVLAEDFHLSYPYTFEVEANWYMIPESCEAGSVRLYKANSFPQQWELVSELLVGERFVDASIVNFDNIWWMFVGIERDENTACDELRLYYADSLGGDWVEHPMSPIVRDNMEISRPAGRIVKIDDRLVRFAQDCTQSYGRNVTAIEIKQLTKDEYREEVIDLNRPYLFELGTLKCNGLGMHHLDLVKLDTDRWIACVDAKGSSID
jgi:hypothetical protein